MTKRQCYLLPILLVVSASAYAQGNGLAGLDEATTMVTSFFSKATLLIYAVAALSGLYGGWRVYNKMQSGDPDTGKAAAAWFGGALFLFVVSSVLRAVFL